MTGINLDCWGFIDGTLRPNCRPGRNQQLVFSGHKRTHGLKFQGLTTPNGLVAHLSGPYEGTRHDSGMLAQSGLLQDLETFMPHYSIYGDAGYPLRPQLCTRFKERAGGISPEQQQFNTAMDSARVCVEWSFGKIVQEFAFLDFKKNLKLYLQPIGLYYKICAMLINCHSCLYGSQTQDHFNCAPPILEYYLETN